MPSIQAGIGGAAAHDAGDFLDQGPHLRRVWARDVGVIERGRIAEAVGCGGEPALVSGVVEAIEQIDLGVILLMQEGVGGFHPRGKAVAVGETVEALAVGGRRGGEIIEAEIGALVPGAALDALGDAGTVIAERRAIDARGGAPQRLALQPARGRSERVPIVRLVTRGDGAHSLVEQCDLRLEGVAEQA